MEQLKEQHGESRTVFDAYLNLQSESYEFVSRTIAIHNWLEEAFSIMQENPHLTAEQLREAWRPVFVQVYRHLFAAFLRPYHLALFPLGESHELQREYLPVKRQMDTYRDFFKTWTEAPGAFMRGFYGAPVSPVEKPKKPSARNGKAHIDELLTVTPFNLMVSVVDEEAKVYLEALERFFGTLGEAEFLLPKGVVVNIQKVLSIQPRIYALAESYEIMLQGAWEESLKKFSIDVKENEAPKDFKEFFDRYSAILAKEYDRLLRSHKFIEVQSHFVTLTAEMTSSLRQAMEEQLEVFPHFPLVTVSKMTALAKTVHSYKRKIANLERKLMDLEERMEKLPQRVEPKSLPEFEGAGASDGRGDVRW